MGHILHEIWPFLASVFEHWQIWLSGGGLGGLIVIATTLLERFTDWKLSKKQHFVLFLVAFFLCSCFLSWVDKDDALHTSESEASKQLTNSLGLLNEVRSDYGQLRSDCAYQKGVMDTLGKQNRDQQNSINNCQTQAIKLLTPQPLKWVPLALESTQEGANVKASWLLLTNKPLTPVDFLISCTGTITAVDGRIAAAPTTSLAAPLTGNQWELKISSPIWDELNPILIHTTSIGQSGNTICNFTFRNGVP